MKNGDKVKYAYGLEFIFIGNNPFKSGDAYCVNPTTNKIDSLPIERLKISEPKEEAVSVEEAIQAIKELIQVKEWKEEHGKDAKYMQAKPTAWTNIRELVLRYESLKQK